MSQKGIACPSCGAALEIDETAPAGTVIGCPHCGVGLTLSGAKNRRLEVKEPAKPAKSAKGKARPRLAWGMGGVGVLLLAPAS